MAILLSQIGNIKNLSAAPVSIGAYGAGVLSSADNAAARLQIDVLGNHAIQVAAMVETCAKINVLAAHIG